MPSSTTSTTLVLLAVLLLLSTTDAFQVVTSPLNGATRASSSSSSSLAATADKSKSKSSSNIGTLLDDGDCIPEDEFCMIDEDTGKPIRLTLEEKERMFIDSLQSYYSSGRSVMSDTDFDALTEDLQWNGSEMVQMNQKEIKYMSAMQEYTKGTPVLSNEEFDELKVQLMEEGSKFAVDKDPKCYIDSGICKATFAPDNFRSNLLYLPAGAILFLVWLFFSFELIEPIIRINPVILALLGAPLVVPASKAITENLVFQNQLILFGPCPSCNLENRVYFGDILFVDGFSDVASCRCKGCKVQFNVQRNTFRASTLPK